MLTEASKTRLRQLLGEAFATAFKKQDYDETRVEVFVDPTTKELAALADSTPHKRVELRGFLTADHIYLWPAYWATHFEVGKRLTSLPYDASVKRISIAFESPSSKVVTLLVVADIDNLRSGAVEGCTELIQNHPYFVARQLRVAKLRCGGPV